MNAEEISREMRDARERVQNRRTQEFHDALAKLVLADAGSEGTAGPEGVRAAALARYPHLDEATRASIVARALVQMEVRLPTPSGEDMSETNTGGRLNDEQREAVRDRLRDLLEAEPDLAPSAARRRIEEELGIAFSPTTFYSGYWQRVKLEMTASGPAESSPTPHTGGREPPGDGTSRSGEHLSMLRDISGDYRVQLDVVLPRAEALRLMQAIVGSLPPEE